MKTKGYFAETVLNFTGANAECLRTWRGERSEPYVHLIHTLNAAGMLFAPALGTQLLPREDGEANWRILPEVLTPVQSYFMLMGVLTLLVAPANFYFGVVHSKQHAKEQPVTRPEAPKKSRPLKLLLVTFVVLFALRTPLKLLGIMITAFGASSHLRLSSAEGAGLSSLYWMCVIAVRLVSIALSTRINGRKMIYVLMATSILSCLYVVCRGSDLTLTDLQVSLAIAAIGAGPQVAINLTLFQELHPVDMSISGILMLGHILGLKLFSPIVGLFVDAHPFFLFSLPIFTCSICLAIYVLLEVFRPNIKHSLALVEEED